MTVMLAVVAGLVVAPRATLLVLAVAGLGAQFAGILADHGVGAAVLLLSVTGLLTWLFGAARGLLHPRAGAGVLLLVGVLVVAGVQAVLPG